MYSFDRSNISHKLRNLVQQSLCMPISKNYLVKKQKKTFLKIKLSFS